MFGEKKNKAKQTHVFFRDEIRRDYILANNDVWYTRNKYN